MEQKSCCSHYGKFRLPYFGSPLVYTFISLALTNFQLLASQTALFLLRTIICLILLSLHISLATSTADFCLYLLTLSIPPPSCLVCSKMYKDITLENNIGHILLKIPYLYKTDPRNINRQI